MASDWTDDRHIRSDRPGRGREAGAGRIRARARADAPQSRERARRRRCDTRAGHQSQRVSGGHRGLACPQWSLRPVLWFNVPSADRLRDLGAPARCQGRDRGLGRRRADALIALESRMSRLVSRLIGGWRTGLARPVLILQAGNALNYFGYGLILPFEIIYLHQIRGFSTSTAGLVLGAIMATAAIATPPTGALLDRYSPKAILVAGSVASAVGYAGFAFVDQPWQAFFCAIIGGVGNGAAGTANRVLVFRLVRPEQRAASVALSRVAGNFGLGLGATVAGFLVAAAQQLSSFQLLYAFDAVTFVGFALIVLAAVPVPNAVPAASTKINGAGL